MTNKEDIAQKDASEADSIETKGPDNGSAKTIKQLRKERAGLRKIFLQGIILLLSIVTIAPLLILSVFSLGDLLASDNTGKYLNLTNIGFALFAGVATLMFNWARSLDPKDYAFETEQINETGEKAIIGGLGFLIASLFQFLQTLPHERGILGLMPAWYYEVTPHLILITFVLTSFFAMVIILQIVTIYAEVLHVRKNLKNPEVSPM